MSQPVNDPANPRSDSDQCNDNDSRTDLEQQVSDRERRKIEARNQQNRTIWFGLGTFGLVGWSITIPALIGIALGAWIDSRMPSRFSWTLMLMFLGTGLGCLNAWRWVSRESQPDQEN